MKAQPTKVKGIKAGRSVASQMRNRIAVATTNCLNFVSLTFSSHFHFCQADVANSATLVTTHALSARPRFRQNPSTFRESL